MKSKLLNAALILTSLLAYLEWGGGNRMLLYEGEREILHKLTTDPASVLHPFILLPLFGQLVLLFTLFQRQVSKRLTLIGLWSIAVLLLFIFVIGIVSLNAKILLSTLPFVVVAVLTILHHRKQN